MTIQVFRLFDQCSHTGSGFGAATRGSHTGSGFGVWGLAVSTARFSVSYSFAPFTRNRAPLPRVLTAALRLR